MADAEGWAECVTPITRAGTHRILAPHTEWMLGSPPCARLTLRILANARHSEAEPAVPALEGGRPDKSASGEAIRAKLATERVHRQLTVGLVLPVPLPHRNLGSFLRNVLAVGLRIEISEKSPGLPLNHTVFAVALYVNEYRGQCLR